MGKHRRASPKKPPAVSKATLKSRLLPPSSPAASVTKEGSPSSLPTERSSTPAAPLSNTALAMNSARVSPDPQHSEPGSTPQLLVTESSSPTDSAPPRLKRPAVITPETLDFPSQYLRLFLLAITFAQVVSNNDITVETLDGDTVDCVYKRNQPAFDHPLLKHHKIQESPSIPKMIKTETKSKWHTHEAHPSIANCPEGTIPVRRDYATNDDNTNAPREYAVVSTGEPPMLYGAKATINVWAPTVEREDEMSISQIWISSGNYETNDLNTIEVGLQVLPELYQDNKPRLFIYWTMDGYNTTGCYNLQCAGFIQINNQIVLGGVMTPVSTFGGKQFEITISVWKEQKYGNWWLSLGENNTLVGYWPGEIFTSLASHAREVQWGGEIVNLGSSDRHTTTQMGSGRFPDEGFGNASYFRSLQIVDNNYSLQPVQDFDATADHPKFYKIKNMTREDWGLHFFYGGPGYIPKHSGVASLALGLCLFYFSLSLHFII